jgi:cellulose synthase/poly-beta-1,6-N-acetylglucosamine synthase-like glycosyltransferase
LETMHYDDWKRVCDLMIFRNLSHKEMGSIHKTTAWISSHPKGQRLYIIIILMYVAIAVPMNLLLFSSLNVNPTMLYKCAVIMFVAMLNIFWLFGSFFLVRIIFIVFCYRLRENQPSTLTEFPSVAILYTTCDDFQISAVLSCVQMDYPHFHVFILDDSRELFHQQTIDKFAADWKEKVTVVRREDKSGFKAGNLNNALKYHIHGYEYFLVADADSRFPNTFLTQLLPYFKFGYDIGFVQGGLRHRPEQTGQFAHDLGPQIGLTGQILCQPKNRFGWVFFLGHGGIVRYDVWKKAGGFPEVLSEDLVFSMRAARLGYRGYYVHDVYSYEDFPETFRDFRRRQERYVRGVVHVLCSELYPFLKTPNLRWFEKLDLLFGCGALLLPALFLLFMVHFCITMPLLVGTTNFLRIKIGCINPVMLPLWLYDPSFNNLTRHGLILLAIMFTLTPAMGAFACRHEPLFKRIKLLLLSAVPYLSLTSTSMLAIFAQLMGVRADWNVTGARESAQADSGQPSIPRSCKPGLRTWLPRWISTSSFMGTAFEFFLGFILASMCIMSFNMVMFVPVLALLTAPVITRTSWDSWFIRPVLYAPLAILIVGFLVTSGLL